MASSFKTPLTFGYPRCEDDERVEDGMNGYDEKGADCLIGLSGMEFVGGETEAGIGEEFMSEGRDVEIPSSSSLCTEAMVQETTLLAKMHAHCQHWQGMRNLVNSRRDGAKLYHHLSKDGRISKKELEVCYVCDFAQNLAIPHFGGEQPGETYYYSLLNINVFGIVDYATEKLFTGVYTEGDGKKGGNNVVSMLYHKMEMDGYIKNGGKRQTEAGARK